MLEGGGSALHRAPPDRARVGGHRHGRSRALLVAVAAAHAVDHVGLPEARLNLAHATIYLARAQVERRHQGDRGRIAGRARARRDPPKALRDTHYPGAKKLGHGAGYIYPPNDPSGYEVDNLPDELKGSTYYEPSGEGGDARALEDAGAEGARRELDGKLGRSVLPIEDQVHSETSTEVRTPASATSSIARCASR